MNSETLEQEAAKADAAPTKLDDNIASIIARCQKDKGLAARLRRADSPATGYQSWGLISNYLNLNHREYRESFALVIAHMARTKAKRNGGLGLGRALAACYPDGRKSSQASDRLRRLLACSDADELLRVLRPMLSLIGSRVSAPMNFSALIRQLENFTRASIVGDDESVRVVKAEWAQDFYGGRPAPEGREFDAAIAAPAVVSPAVAAVATNVDGPTAGSAPCN